MWNIEQKNDLEIMEAVTEDVMSEELDGHSLQDIKRLIDEYYRLHAGPSNNEKWVKRLVLDNVLNHIEYHMGLDSDIDRW